MNREQLVAAGWRQFSILDPKSLKADIPKIPENALLIATNYDCAVVNDSAEENVCEFIVAIPTESPNPMWRYSHNPRNLVFPISTPNGETFFHVKPNDRFFIDKSHLVSAIQKIDFELLEASKRELKYWLAQRYLSIALPDDLEDSLTAAKKVLHECLKKFAKNSNMKDLIEALDVYVYYFEEQEDGFSYTVGYYLIVEDECLDLYREKLEELQQKLKNAVESAEGIICDEVRLDKPSGFNLAEMAISKRIAYIDEHSFRSLRS